MFEKDALKGKVVLVVGGSSESGPGVCSVLAEHGADIALTYKTKRDDAGRVVERCKSIGVEAESYAFDVLKTERAAGLVREVVGKFGSLDILVNLGGPPPVYTDLRELDEKGYDSMMNAFVKGAFFLSREAAFEMEKGEGGLVVFVSATSSMKYSHGAYGMSKACMSGIVPFLAHSFAPKVRIIDLVPGLIDIEETDQDLRKQRAEESPLESIVTPREIGLLVIAAYSPAFAGVTGEHLLADGGFWLLHR
jgi:3-oxoacyl-[acyl-carrier protein] reductase